MLRIAICDDNIYFSGKLEEWIKEEASYSGMDATTEVFYDGYSLEEYIQMGNRYDLIFLDIEMKRMNGIEAARLIRKFDKTVLLIYVSGYEQYLKELFEVEPFRFLSKPLNKIQFSRYFKEAYQRIKETETYYQFSFNKEIKKIAIRDIIYFESRNRVIHIFLQDGTVEAFYWKLNNVEKELLEGKQRFLRIHQSFLVNYDYIKKMNFSSIVLDTGSGKEIDLKISEDRQKVVRMRLCEIADGKAVIE